MKAEDPEIIVATPEEMFACFARMEKHLENIQQQLEEINAQMGVVVDETLGIAEANHEDMEKLTEGIGRVLMAMFQQNQGDLGHLVGNVFELIQGFKKQPK